MCTEFPGELAAKLAVIDLPVSLGMESHLHQPVLGIVPFSASWTDQIAAPCSSLAIIIFRNRKGRAATAGDQKHAERRLSTGFLGALALGFHDSSTAAKELLLRLFACRIFFRSRSDFGVTSTNSSSAM